MSVVSGLSPEVPRDARPPAVANRLVARRGSFTPGGIVGQSRGMLKLFEHISKAASVDAHVLILGESGAGKERVAKAIHDSSARKNRPFLAVNCAAIPEHLLEAELFGYERGAFTGAHNPREGLLEAAHGGVLFFDEICELSPGPQAKLLRAVEEGGARRLGGKRLIPFDVRFMAATNREIHDEIRRGRFRADLFFRLDVIEIHAPPLRHRREDIPLLAAHFLKTCSSGRRSSIEGIAPETVELLISYDWPGNVRELKNAIERAAAYAGGAWITPGDLPENVLKGAGPRRAASFQAWKRETLERLEREFLAETLAAHAGIVSRASKALGLHRSSLQRLMRKHHLPPATPAA